MSDPVLSASHPQTQAPAVLWPVLTGALLAIMLAALDQSIVNTALPRIATDLGGMGHLSWLVTSFLLCATITTPLYGKLSDQYGRRHLFFVAILLFLAGSLLCGAARSMPELIGCRGLQGLGAGGLLVLAQSAIGDVVAPIDRPRYQGLFTGTLALASVAGPLLGGIITQALSWRWVFYINLPIGLLALAMIATGLRAPVPVRIPGQAIDFAGALLLACATTALLLLLSWGGGRFGWLSADAAGLALLTAALFALFIHHEHGAADPLIRLALFGNPVFARGVAVGGMMVFAMLGSTVFLPLYFQLVLGMTPAAAGAMLLPQVTGMLLTSIAGGRIVARMGRNKPFLLAGIGLEAASLLGLAVLAYAGAPTALFLISMTGLGLGMGMGMPNLTNAVQNAVEHRELGAATGAMTFLRSLGGAAGVAASGAIMTARLSRGGGIDIHALAGHGAAALSGIGPARRAMVSYSYRTALTGSFLLSGLVMTAALLLVLSMPELRLRGRIGA